MVFAIYWHESAMDLHVFPFPILPPASLPTRSLWVFPMHQPWALISCIQPGLAICFTLDSILVSMLFSHNIPPSPSPTESKSLFCTSVRRHILIYIWFLGFRGLDCVHGTIKITENTGKAVLALLSFWESVHMNTPFPLGWSCHRSEVGWKACSPPASSMHTDLEGC